MTTGGVELVHVTGNQNSREVARALGEQDLLAHLTTTIGVATRGSTAKPGVGGWLGRREFAMLSPAQIRSYPARELVRLVLTRAPIAGLRRLAKTGGPADILWVTRGLDRRVAARLARERPDAVYGYNDQCSATSVAARELDIPLVLELQHAHWRTYREVVRAERERSPEWASTLIDERVFDTISKQQDTELSNASLVISPSRQVSESVLTVDPQKRIAQIAYGCPTPNEQSWRSSNRNGPLRLLYVGRVVATKGAADLASMLTRLDRSVELTIIGSRPAASSPAIDALLSKSRYMGTVPRDRVLSEMRAHDLLVLPSLIEGRSLSVLEALSQGLPAVVTPGTGTEDIVGEGGGLVVPNASPDRLTEAIEDVLTGASSIEDMSTAAIDSARRHTWTDFGQRVATALREVLSENLE